MCSARPAVDGAHTVIAYLGPRHSFTHLAARPLLQHPGCVGLACETADEVVDRVRDGRAGYGFLAAGTNLAGTVASHREQIERGGLVVVGERDYRASIACAARPGVRIDQVVRVWSHEHPLLECAHWLAVNLPEAERVPVRSSSAAARRAAADPEPAAALCSSAAAVDRGLEVLMADVADPPGDLTRFVLLGRPDTVPPDGLLAELAVEGMGERAHMGEVITIRGPVPSESLGVTLMHEHLLINWTREFRSDGLLNDERLVTEEVAAFAAASGSTIVEVSTSQLTVGVTDRPTATRASGTRTDDSVRALVRIAEAGGVNLVLGTGHYRHPYFDHALINRSTADALAEQMVQEIEHGFGDTGVRAGLVGEIGCDRWYLSAEEERSFRASARAARRTGVCLSTHAVDYPVGLLQLDLLAEERLDPERTIIGHCDTVDLPEYHDEILRRGAWVQFDTIRGLTERDITRRVEMITRLVRDGHAGRLLLSQDVCKKSHLRANGGNGYDFLITSFLDRLRAAGISEEEITTLTVHNPARVLAR